MTYVQPLLAVFLVIGFIGLLRIRRSVPGWRWLTVCIVGTLLISWPPLDWVLSRPLEARYPIRPFPAQPTQAIVVLSAGVKPPVYERPYALMDGDTFGRVGYAAWLYKNWRPVPVLASGGLPARGGTVPFSDAMRDFLQKAGVPANMIWTEDRSRSTYENALYSAEILRKHGISKIALAVEAQSMPRAAACFRKLGFQVVPAPSDFRELGPIFRRGAPELEGHSPQ